MSTSFHTYPEYEADIRAAFDALAARCGLRYVAGSMPKYVGASLELKFGIDLQTPELYLSLKGCPTLTEQTLWAAARLPEYVPGLYSTGRAHAQARLAFWVTTLAPLLPALSEGDHSRLDLAAIDQEAYEDKLRRYVHYNAPMNHIARANLWASDWRKYADAFLQEKGGKIE